MKIRYYVRIDSPNVDDFELYLTRQEVEFKVLSVDWGKSNSTNLYSILMDDEEKLSLTLSFPVIGMAAYTEIY